MLPLNFVEQIAWGHQQPKVGKSQEVSGMGRQVKRKKPWGLIQTALFLKG